MSERKDTRLFRDLLLQILFVVLFVLLLLWLFPTKKFVSKNDKKVVCEGTTCSAKVTDNNTKILVDRIFNENIVSMKDAGKSYYTLERLPQNVGDKKKITLGEMLDQKIILPFTDKNGDTCDPTKSYVEVVKYENEYVMKVNLKCGKEENYLLVHMGCYDYCKTTICEKKRNDVSNPTIYQASTNTVVNVEKDNTINNNTSNTVINNGSNNTVINNNTNNNTIINNNGNTVINNNTTINNNNVVVEKYYCVIVNGKYYDKNSNSVTREEYEISCDRGSDYKCTIINGVYYDANGKKVSKAEYEKSCNIKPDYKCVIVDGVYYDINGNKVSKAEYQKSCEPSKEYLYEYSKTTEGYYTETDWSEWQTTEVKASSTVSVQTKTVNTTKLIGYNVKKAYDYNKPIYEEKEVETGMYETKEVCTKYDYVPTGKYTYGNWVKQGRVYLDYSPKDTETTKYVYVDDSQWVCGANCTAGTTHAYDKYTRTATALTEYKCTKYETKSVPIKTKVKTIVGYETYIVSKTPVYKEEQVVYYRYKTRTYHPGTTDIKWSYYNDKSLLNAGYNYTGNKKVKN
ncbi:MAG: hypothetical protein IKN87_05210 [Bacilli bacterium]|nr:hypothetical protein [Bacilli bacterium]